VGIISSIFNIPVMSSLINNMNSVLTGHGYVSMLGDSKFDIETEKKLIIEFLSRRVDGMLIRTCMPAAELEKIIAGRVPYVAFDHNFDGINVTMSRYAGAFLAIEHLIKTHKHQRIGFVQTPGSEKKLSGYMAALQKYNIQFNPEFVINIESQCNIGNTIATVIKQKITAVFCINDFVARRVISDLTFAGKSVPEDVAVVGFDGLDMICDLVRPSLTSVRQPVTEIADLACSLLIKKIKGEIVENKNYLLEPTLRIGRSCGCSG
jgi:DNA-binding LacI/PurR family transcriptional regulator